MSKPSEDVETLRQQAFQQLKPFCITVSRSILTPRPNAQALTSALSNLYSTLQSVSKLHANVINNSLGDYVFFPLSHVFRQHLALNDRALELGLQCLEILIRTCWRLNVPTELAKQLLVLTTFVVGGAVPGAEPEGKQRSEETKLAGMKCLLAFFGSLERTGKSVLADAQYLPVVGHTVTTILGVLIEGASSIDLQTVALDAIGALLFRCVDEDDIIASFYPGVVSGLVKVIGLGGTTKRPYKTLRNTVELLTSVICRVLGDRQTSGLQPDESGALIAQSPAETPKERNKNLKVHRTTAWLKVAASNTKTALENILRLRTHPKNEVRRAVFELCRDLLELCNISMAEAIAPLVESMVVFSGDEDDEDLARLAESTLRVLMALSQNIKDAIQTSLHGWIVALPRVMRTNDEDAKARLITRLAASFKILAEVGLETELLQDMLAGNIRDSLIAANPTKIGKEITPQTIDDNRVSLDILLVNNKSFIDSGKIVQFPDVILGHRSQLGTVSSMKKLLGLLGSTSGTALALAQRLIQESSQTGSPERPRSTSLWIAVQLLRGSLSSPEEDEFFDFEFSPTSGLQQRVTEELLSVSLSVLSNATDATFGEDEFVSSPMLQCLALESLSLISQAQKQSFRGDLVDTLYPIVHLLGASSREVQNHAIIALNNIAQFCAYPSAKDLLLFNVDYMVNAVSLKLNMFDLSSQAPVVVEMMIKLAGASLLPYLDDTVVSIFSALDSFHGYEGICEALFGVLGEIVEESAKVRQLAAITTSGNDDTLMEHSEVKMRKLLTSQGLVASLKHGADKARPRIEPLGNFAGEMVDESGKEEFSKDPWGKSKQKMEELPKDNNHPPPSEEKVTKPTKSYELVQRITRLSQHYLTHDSPTLRMKLLRLVTTASPLLATNEDEYLPLVNDVWPVVFNRILEDESHVVIAAADAISQLAKSCGGFMASRVDESWPSIKIVYTKAYKRLEMEMEFMTGSMGTYSLNYRTWDSLCRLLTSVAVNVPVSNEVMDEMCEVVGAKVLVQRGDLRRALEWVNEDAVWLEVQSWRSANGRVTGVCRAMPVVEGIGIVPVAF